MRPFGIAAESNENGLGIVRCIFSLLDQSPRFIAVGNPVPLDFCITNFVADMGVFEA